MCGWAHLEGWINTQLITYAYTIRILFLGIYRGRALLPTTHNTNTRAPMNREDYKLGAKTLIVAMLRAYQLQIHFADSECSLHRVPAALKLFVWIFPWFSFVRSYLIPSLYIVPQHVQNVLRSRVMCPFYIFCTCHIANYTHSFGNIKLSGEILRITCNTFIHTRAELI
jgi:hypothetical protein